jgi:uncharacterized protein (UPF0332 family)
MEKSSYKNKSLNGRDYIESAKERLKSAKVLLEPDSYPDSVSRSYYAFLDVATAALITKDLFYKSHAGAIDLFSMHFIKTNLVDTKYIKWFKRIKKDREDADYKYKKKFTKEDAQEAYQEAVEFVKMIEELFYKILTKKGVRLKW